MSKKSIVKNITVSSLDVAVMAMLEPVIKVIDQNHPAELGHEAPSRNDGLLKILMNNFCRDVHQQIYGVNTDNYKFAGIKDNWDRAQNAVAQLEAKYRNAPEDMEFDPNCGRFLAWYEQAEAKYTMLSDMLNQLQDVYKQITGTDWEYIAPGARPTKSALSPAEAAKALREKLAKKAQNETANTAAA